MADATDAAGPPRIRVHYIWTPDFSRGASGLILLAVGILISWILAYVVFLCLVYLVLGLPDQLSGTAYGAAILLGAVGPFTWVVFLNRRRIHRSAPWLRARLSRLESVLKASGAGKRLPHRAIEAVLGGKALSASLLKLHIQAFRASGVVCVNFPRPHESRPLPNGIPFEPIPLIDTDQLEQLVEANIEHRVGLAANPQHGDDREGASSCLLAQMRQFLSLGWTALWLAWIGHTFYRLIVLGSTDRFLFLSMLFISAAAAPTYALFVEKSWYLVPGGLLFRMALLWRSRPRYWLLTPPQTPLIVDLRAGLAGVLVEGRPQVFTCPDIAAWAVVAAWISTARTPTMDEIRSYLDIHPEPEDPA